MYLQLFIVLAHRTSVSQIQITVSNSLKDFFKQTKRKKVLPQTTGLNW